MLDSRRRCEKASSTAVWQLGHYSLAYSLASSLSLRDRGRGTGSTTLWKFKLLIVVVVLVIVLDIAIIPKAGLDLLALQTAAHLLALLNLPALQRGRCMDLEAVAAGEVALGGLGGRQGGIDLE